MNLVPVLRRVVLRRDDEPAALPSTSIHSFDQINQFLSVRQGPVDLVVVARAQIRLNVSRALAVGGERGSVVSCSIFSSAVKYLSICYFVKVCMFRT